MSFTLKISSKQLQRVNRCLRDMFSSCSFMPLTLENFQALKFPESLRRRINLSPTGSSILLTEKSLAAMDRLVAILSTDRCDGLWTNTDIGGAVREIYESCLKARQQPESAQEFVDLVTSKVNSLVRNYSFLAALQGVEMTSAVGLSLGRLRLVPTLRQAIVESGVRDDLRLADGNIEAFMQLPCIVGSTKGTINAAKEWYREQSQLAVGMLAVEAGASYQEGATKFNIELVFERNGGTGGATYHFFWDDVNRNLGGGLSWRRGQALELTVTKVSELEKVGAFSHAFSILQKHNRTDLEDSIARAIYWYGDAHRDNLPVMQFVKYWSCLECLLGGVAKALPERQSGEALTVRLSTGLVAVLTYGHFILLEESDFSRNLKTVERLYGIRSKAVHRALHSHVSNRDLSTISIWAAWVIYNAISFSNAGMEKTSTLWENVTRVAQSR